MQDDTKKDWLTEDQVKAEGDRSIVCSPHKLHGLWLAVMLVLVFVGGGVAHYVLTQSNLLSNELVFGTSGVIRRAGHAMMTKDEPLPSFRIGSVEMNYPAGWQVYVHSLSDDSDQSGYISNGAIYDLNAGMDPTDAQQTSITVSDTMMKSQDQADSVIQAVRDHKDQKEEVLTINVLTVHKFSDAQTVRYLATYQVPSVDGKSQDLHLFQASCSGAYQAETFTNVCGQLDGIISSAKIVQ